MTLLLQRFPSFRSPALRSTGVAAVLLLAAPPGATQSHPRGPTGSRALDPVLENPVVTTLNAFGISTAPTPRQDELGQDLDTSYGPLGGSVVLERTDELVMVGLDLQGDDEQRQFFLYQDGTGGAPAGYYDPEILYDMGVDEMEDLRPAVANGRAPQSYRAVASGDVDGDGLEEVLVLHRAGRAVLHQLQNGGRQLLREVVDQGSRVVGRNLLRELGDLFGGTSGEQRGTVLRTQFRHRLHGQTTVPIGQHRECGFTFLVLQLAKDLREVGRMLFLKEIQEIGGRTNTQQSSD